MRVAERGGQRLDGGDPARQPARQLTGAVNESAFIRDLQWDTWGTHIVHVDFTRISEHEIVEVRVPVELRGESPGVREGGVVVQHIHEVEIACPASVIPERLAVNINHLMIEQSILLGSIELPEGAKILSGDLEEAVVECIIPKEMPEDPKTPKPRLN